MRPLAAGGGIRRAGRRDADPVAHLCTADDGERTPYHVSETAIGGWPSSSRSPTWCCPPGGRLLDRSFHAGSPSRRADRPGGVARIIEPTYAWRSWPDPRRGRPAARPQRRDQGCERAPASVAAPARHRGRLGRIFVGMLLALVLARPSGRHLGALLDCRLPSRARCRGLLVALRGRRRSAASTPSVAVDLVALRQVWADARCECSPPPVRRFGPSSPDHWLQALLHNYRVSSTTAARCWSGWCSRGRRRRRAAAPGGEPRASGAWWALRCW